jgi:iron complex outermembrane receptor protein
VLSLASLRRSFRRMSSVRSHSSTFLKPRLSIFGKQCLGFVSSAFVCFAFLLSTSVLLAKEVAAKSVSYELNIPAENLDAALQAVALASHHKLLYRAELVAGKASRALIGNYTTEQAVGHLLEGTSLSFEITPASVVLIKGEKDTPVSSSAQVSPDQSQSPNKEESGKSSQDFRVAQVDQGSTRPQVGENQNSEKKKKDDGLSEIVVTGTHIRGVGPVGAPVTMYSREDVEQSGAATIDQFARLMPENFAGMDPLSSAVRNNASQFTLLSQSSGNTFSGASFNLHGLGPGATLTLLNGHRLAPGGFNGAFIDITQIPVSAIDRIEVLPDGASAIYGADAVAGVVNIVTRKDFEGAETTVRYGAATLGGAGELTGSQLFGASWDGGHVLADYEYDDQRGLDASQRDYIPSQGGPYSLIPKSHRDSIFVTGSQALGDSTTLFGDGIYGNRGSFQDLTVNAPGAFSSSGSDGSRVVQSGLTLSIEQQLPHTWIGTITATYSKLQQRDANDTSQLTEGSETPFVGSERIDAASKIVGIDTQATGALWAMPGGSLKVAVGAGFRGEKFEVTQLFVSGGFPGSSPETERQRHVASVYGELFMPIITEQNALPMVQRLEVSAAGRYDHYSDFGATTNPKLGAIWAPIRSLDVRGTYGTSYRAPLLSQLASPMNYEAGPFPDSTSSIGFTDTLFEFGGNPNLGAEKSRSISAGIDLNPSFAPALVFAATYFRTTYDNRITTPPNYNPVLGIGDPTIAAFVNRNPPLTDVQNAFNSPGFVGDFSGLGPSGVQAIYNGRFANIAASKQSGVDVSARYSIPIDPGALNFAIAAEKQLNNDYQISPSVPLVRLLNTFGEPVAWKGRGNIGWVQGAWASSLSINYISGYNNNFTSSTSRIASWTTADLFLAYKVNSSSQSMFSNCTFSLSVQNLTDEKPPFIAIPSTLLGGAPAIPFDSANASPIGRLIAVQVSKRWGQH